MTQKTISILDSNLLSFYENNVSTAKLLRKIIQKKEKFPKNEFLKLKDAFPCILSGIRDYAEYIPLEADLFDLIIIDEASQVSIAQALPALIRAKKVLVLGDKMQFSNVKSAQARNDLNKEYTNSLRESLNKSKFKDVHTQKLEYFDIKSSILLFFELIANYQTMLYKYFRGYKEIISYSNKYFYNNQLQIMKIRGKNIDDVIKFSKIKHDGKIETTPKTNKLECDFIVDSVSKLYASNFDGDVGIITPHTNQQKLLLNEFRKLTNYSDIDKKFNLKIMTFDTCQGEERDIIYYSMVANPAADSLWGIFSKDFKDIDFEEDGKIRAQRLNVGFSRAKEQMHFVISKDTSEFNGEVGNALRFYENMIEISKKEKPASSTDSKSPMESKILDTLYKTQFWQNNNEFVEVQPQFELGKYLSQEKEKYNHPFYRVDFLLTYKKEERSINIIIEYDGFKEHFKELQNVNSSNHQDYYNDEDILRQKTLESYGYKFLRINKFNLGDNPIKTLDSRLNEVIASQEKLINQTLKEKIEEKINGLNVGEKKECPKCEKVLDMEEFHDESLTKKYGRICNSCKKEDENYRSSRSRERIVKVFPAKPVISNNISNYSSEKCPKCGKRLVRRHGKYGSFTGCSGYPYCSYTR
jgi:very-short-patch-repair endonuclease